MTEINDTLWAELSSQHNLFLAQSDGLVVPTEAEIERFKAHKASGGAIFSNLDERLGYNYAYPGNKDRQEALEFAIQISKDKALLEAVENGLKTKEITPDFFRAWGLLERAAGILAAMVASEEDAKYMFENYETSQDCNIIQEYIYAYWMVPRWVDGGVGREEAEDQLADVIHDAVNDKSLDTKWLIRMIKHESGKPTLQGKITKFSKDKLKGYIARAAIRQDELPAIGY